jgi:uncharacterized protein (DUF305 family)
MRAVLAAAPAAALVGALLLAAGCADPNRSPVTDPRPPATGQATDVTSPTAPAGPLNATDLAWVLLMIPLDEQALRLLALVPERTPDRAVRQLAARFGAGYREELVRLRGLLKRAGIPETNPHEGHDMPGMVTAAELRAIGGTTGAAFGRLFAAALRENLEQAALVARGEQASGSDRATRTLAAAVERTRATQLTQLARLGVPAG